MITGNDMNWIPEFQDNDRFYGMYRNWHISSGETDDGRPPIKSVYVIHDSCDGSDDRWFWVDTIDEAISRIDEMPDFGDREDD